MKSMFTYWDKAGAQPAKMTEIISQHKWWLANQNILLKALIFGKMCPFEHSKLSFLSTQLTNFAMTMILGQVVTVCPG